MKLYLSSFRLGSKENVQILKQMVEKTNKKVAYIPNALDFATDLERKNQSEQKDITELENLGLEVEKVDLRGFFGKKNLLEKKLEEFGIIWVRGGNTFVLRKAMELSGFDEIITEHHRKEKDVLYGGYSAGVCILGPENCLQNFLDIDDPNQKPYGSELDVNYDGLGILEYLIVPHFQSDHPESEAAEREIERMKGSGFPYKPLKDGEVIIIGEGNLFDGIEK